jgi:DNA-binding winged helix-turn-helix (wHTH) protein/TolB-like protein
MQPPRCRVAFDRFEFDPATGELWRDGARVALQPQPARLLELLLNRRGEVVTRDEIRAALWGTDVHVDFDRSLNFCVAKLRTALDDNAAEPRFVETVPTRGYRFTAADRTQSVAAGHTGRSDRRTWQVAAAVSAIVLVAGIVAARILMTPSGPPKVVVVPFHNETGSSELDRVAKGVSDATVARLAESDRLRVIGNASGLTFSFRPPDMKAMGESLGAQYLVLGQMKRDARVMRVVAHLIRVSDQTHVWAHTYDTDTLDLSQQSSIADAIAGAVPVLIVQDVMSRR